jgi:ParB family chromosome partitioning protein
VGYAPERDYRFIETNRQLRLMHPAVIRSVVGGMREIGSSVDSREECFLMSLVENVARKNQSPVELLREISVLKARGYSNGEIAKKIDLTKTYVVGIVHLLDHGEERLLNAVERGQIPLSIAIQISSSNEDGLQKALCEAYEDKTLRGRRLNAVRRIIEHEFDALIWPHLMV